METFDFIDSAGKVSSFTGEEIAQILYSDLNLVENYRNAVIAGKEPLRGLHYQGKYLYRKLPEGVPDHLADDSDGYSVWNSAAYLIDFTEYVRQTEPEPHAGHVNPPQPKTLEIFGSRAFLD